MFFFYESKPFIAIIGDIRKSKELDDRKEIQEQLKFILEEINRKYEADIAAKFIITLGDEFQGLLFNGHNVIKILQEIKVKLHPVELRFGIGIGKINTEINSEMALGADGPGYYNARKAIETIKNNEKRSKTIFSDIRVEIEKENDQVMLMNTIFELIKSIEMMWTDRQREIIWDMIKNMDGQKNAAKRLGITQPSVQKSLVKGKYYSYEKALKNVEKIIGEIAEC